MSKKFICDFYNLYIPKDKKYENKKEGIIIESLEIVEEFEKNRKKSRNKYSKNLWNTAKCQIKTDNMEEAKKKAYWLELIYSFAQARRVCFLDWDVYKDGKKVSTTYESRFIDRIDNRFSDLIYATKVKGALYTRDISLFVDTAISTLNGYKKPKQEEITKTMHAYIISHSELYAELKYLIAWISLEHLSNSFYNLNKSSKPVFTKVEKKEIKKKLEDFLNSLNGEDDSLKILKRNIMKNYLYEHDTLHKIRFYLNSIDLGFEKKDFSDTIEELYGIRVDLVHNFSSSSLTKNMQDLRKLQKILEQVIFRLLGIDSELQKKFIIHQFEEPKIVQ